MRPALRLPAELTIYTVREVRAQCLDWLACPAPVAVSGPDPAGWPAPVDGAAVAEVDAAGIQLLLSLAREIDAAGGALRLVHPSESLARACDVLGVQRHLGGEPVEAVA